MHCALNVCKWTDNCFRRCCSSYDVPPFALSTFVISSKKCVADFPSAPLVSTAKTSICVLLGLSTKLIPDCSHLYHFCLSLASAACPGCKHIDWVEILDGSATVKSINVVVFSSS